MIIANGPHWELTSFEWNPRTGVARYGYMHRWTDKRVEVTRLHTRYVINESTKEVRRAA